MFPILSGRGWAGQDPAVVATLLHGHPGLDIRGGLRRQGQDRRGEAGAAQDHQ